MARSQLAERPADRLLAPHGLAPPEPQLQHAALRVTARGWEPLPLPAPHGSGALVVARDLHAHDAVAEHTDGRAPRVPPTPALPAGAGWAARLQAERGEPDAPAMVPARSYRKILAADRALGREFCFGGARLAPRPAEPEEEPAAA